MLILKFLSIKPVTQLFPLIFEQLQIILGKTMDFMLIFEGEYSNGIRVGKGKEYYKNDIIFEGEFFKDKRWNG